MPATQRRIKPGVVSVLSLVGKDIDGITADRRRLEGGNLCYDWQDEPHIVTLRRVEVRKRTPEEVSRGIGNGDWVILHWYPDGGPCNHGGCCDSRRNKKWQIRILD